MFQDEREFLREEAEYLILKENCSVDDKLLSSKSPKIGRYHFRRRQESKRNRRNTLSNNFGDETDANYKSQCNYGNQYGTYDYFGYLCQDHNRVRVL